MVANPDSLYLSPDAYLKAEENSLVKHEYQNGYAYAMAGASNTHVLITGNFFALLRSHIRGRNCRAYIADTKVHIAACNAYYYPDIAVSCDPRDRTYSNFLRHPCLIVEVLSATTEAFDRGDKFADYRKLDTLQNYLLVSQTQPCIESFYRNDTGQWIFTPFERDDQLHLANLDFRCPVAAVYEDVDFTAPSTPIVRSVEDGIPP